MANLAVFSTDRPIGFGKLYIDGLINKFDVIFKIFDIIFDDLKIFNLCLVVLIIK